MAAKVKCVSIGPTMPCIEVLLHTLYIHIVINVKTLMHAYVQISVPAVPVFLRVTGLYEVSYQVSVACRDSHVYTIEEGDKTPKFRISLGSQPCGMQKRERNILVACMDQTLSCYSIKVRKRGSGGKGER